MPLDIIGVSKAYETKSGDQLRALDEVSFSVPDGQFVAIVGPSGCGKTTLLEIMAHLREPTTGQVKLGGADIADPQVRKQIGIVFQEDTLFPWRNVIDNVVFALEMRRTDKKKRTVAAEEILTLMDLEDFAGALIAELSGGMRQRVALARTLVMKPRLLLLDEPFGALDAQTRLLLGTEVSALVQREAITVVLVTHSIEEAAMLSDEVIVLSSRPGQIKATVKAGLAQPRGLAALGSEELARIEGEIWDHLRDQLRLV